MRTARLNLTGPNGGTVEINGRDISDSIRGVTVQHSIGHHPQLTLDVRVHVSEVEGEAVVVLLPESTAAALVALGWTPPAEQPIGDQQPRAEAAEEGGDWVDQYANPDIIGPAGR